MPKFVALISVVFCLLLAGCGENKEKPNVHLKDTALKKPMENANRAVVKKISADIDNYVKRHNMKVTETGTGLRYMIYQQGSGVQAKEGDRALISYKVSLLDGTVCYTTEKKGPQEVRIGMDNVESGIHEGLQLMHVGDKAVFILPPNIAHGLIGDMEKIPPLSVIVYNVELQAVR